MCDAGRRRMPCWRSPLEASVADRLTDACVSSIDDCPASCAAGGCVDRGRSSAGRRADDSVHVVARVDDCVGPHDSFPTGYVLAVERLGRAEALAAGVGCASQRAVTVKLTARARPVRCALSVGVAVIR